jgi:hypothetical protein
VAALLQGCAEAGPAAGGAASAPRLTLAQAAPGRLELRIAGDVALRALQARLLFDPGELGFTAIEPAGEAARLDRVFSSPPAEAAGDLVVGITDTRRVLLPARGTLLSLSFELLAGADRARVELADPVGAAAGGAAVLITPSDTEVSAR